MRAVFAEPTKEIASTSGESISASTVSRPPRTRLTTPGGKISCSSISSKMRTEVSGSCSEGLRMNVLPQPTAKGRNQSGIIAGKLNGVIAATTPTGWRTISTSTPRATPSRFSPFSRWGIAIAASTDSIPRPTSPSASAEGLAHVLGDEGGELVAVGVEHLAQLHQVAGADRRRHLAPLALGGLGGRGGGGDGGRAGERDLGEDGAGGGVEVGEGVDRLDLLPGAGDVVAEHARRGAEGGEATVAVSVSVMPPGWRAGPRLQRVASTASASRIGRNVKFGLPDRSQIELERSKGRTVSR